MVGPLANRSRNVLSKLTRLSYQTVGGEMTGRSILAEPIVITGIGLVASVGDDRESVWRAVRHGESRFGPIRGVRGIPDGYVLAAMADLPGPATTRMKAIRLGHLAAEEALRDARVQLGELDRTRFGCSISGHMGDTRWFEGEAGGTPPEGDVPWFEQWMPNTGCSAIANRFDLQGPRLCHSTACSTSLFSILSAVRAIRDRSCDIALAGGGDAIEPLFVAGFKQMRVLADDPDPRRACRPFDRQRKGFVFGEGAAMFVIERLGHAIRRGARIYAEIKSFASLAQGYHMTGVDADSESLEYLIRKTLERAEMEPGDIGYINAHGTGTEQNDAAEATAIRRVFSDHSDRFCVSATKSILGHMINAAGAAELAITALALRDGFAPPTLNLEDPDPVCTFDCVAGNGRINRSQHALKLSLAFGGHLVSLLLSRWNDAANGFGYPNPASLLTPALPAHAAPAPLAAAHAAVAHSPSVDFRRSM